MHPTPHSSDKIPRETSETTDHQVHNTATHHVTGNYNMDLTSDVVTTLNERLRVTWTTAFVDDIPTTLDNIVRGSTGAYSTAARTVCATLQDATPTCMLCGNTKGGSPTRTARHAWHECQHLQHHRRQSEGMRSEHILRGLSADACGVVEPPTVDVGSGINWTNAAVVRPYDGPMNMPSGVLRLGDTRTLVPVWLIDT
jgi:hypothetical protein